MNAHPSSLSDRELLELAAKAAGIRTVTRQYCDLLGVAVKEPGTWVIGRWNPLEDDGDALRLAVKLRIDLDFDTDNPFVEAYRKSRDGRAQVSCEPLTTDADAATRHAIVLAAANLAK